MPRARLSGRFITGEGDTWIVQRYRRRRPPL